MSDQNRPLQLERLNELLDIVCHAVVVMLGVVRRIAMIPKILYRPSDRAFEMELEISETKNEGAGSYNRIDCGIQLVRKHPARHGDTLATQFRYIPLARR